MEEAITLTMAMKLITKVLQFSKRTNEQMELVYAEVMLGRNMRISAAVDAAMSGGGMMQPGMMQPGKSNQ